MNDLFNTSGSYSQEITKEFFKKVYTYMFGALAISGIIAYMAGTEEFFLKYMVEVDYVNGTVTRTPLFWIATFAPLGLGLLIQMAYRRLSMGVLMLAFLAYSVLMGLSLSGIMLVYSGASIAITFFVSAGAFGAMAVLGYTTSTDLTKFGSLMYMLFMGIFISSIVNIWMGSEMLDFVISIVGVFVFTGLTAYFMQQLKNTAQNDMLEGVEREKLALVGGLVLYILFINLFMSLLRLMGSNE